MKGRTSAPRVLLVAARYFPLIGGIEMHVHEVGQRLAGDGFDITVLTTMPYPLPRGLPREEMVDGMRIVRVGAWPRGGDYYFAPEMYGMIARGEWDVVHCQGCHTLVPPLAMLAARRAKIPYVVTFHTGGHSSRLRMRLRGMQWRVQRGLFAGACRLIGISRAEADYFRERLHLPEEQFTIIPNGISTPTGTSTIPGTPTGGPMIMSVGRLERYKGHQYVIGALPKIRERYADARVVIVGVGPYEARLRKLAERVGVAEYVEMRAVAAGDREGMAGLLSQARVVTLLSEREGHPIAVLEALALRRPVLVAATPGLRELAEEGLVRAIGLRSTPEEIAEAVCEQIEAPLVPTEIALPTWDDCVHGLEEVYDACMRSR